MVLSIPHSDPFWLAPFFIATICSFFITMITIRIYHKYAWLDDPQSAKHPKVIHEKAVPRGGGIPIFLGIVITLLLFIPLDKHLLGVIAGGFLLTLVGIADDIWDVNPYIRLTLGLGAALLVVGSGIGIPFISNPLSDRLIFLNTPQIAFTFWGQPHSIWILADIFAVVWITAVMNFTNWSKGLDGQLPGTTMVAALTIVALSQRFSADIAQWSTAIVAAALAGAYFGFLPWNWFPQKIMPGYGGGSLAGYFLAVLSILSTTKVGTLMIVLGIPLIDALYVIVRRIWAGQSPVWGDTRHLHHALLARGWSKSKVAYFYWIVTSILGIIALQLNSTQKLYTFLALIIGFGAVLIWLHKARLY